MGRRSMRAWGLLLLVAVGCSAQAPAPSPSVDASAAAASAQLRPEDWIGVYSSTSEIAGFTGTVVVISEGLTDGLHYDKTFHSDVHMADDIQQDSRSGSCLTEGDRLYLPEAYGYMRDGKPHLLASIDR